jgi:hypothetical protein
MKHREPPHVPDTPGLRWRWRNSWEAIWRARADIVKKGFRPKNKLLWKGNRALTDYETKKLQDECQSLQSEMLTHARGGIPDGTYDGTLASLIHCYRTDEDSTFRKLRFEVRKNQDHTLRRIVDRHGAELVSEINARTLLRWHKEWSHNGLKVAIAHAFVGHLRTISTFGMTILEDGECARLNTILSKMRFEMPKPRTERMTADQANAIRAQAHLFGWYSIALAQAFQFELMLRQRDVIGEWIPLSEPGISNVVGRRGKWLRGLRWEEIDQNLVLRHTTSKRQKDIEVNLRNAPMIMAELQMMEARDGCLPTSGPVCVCEATARAWIAGEYRRKWRIVARAAGVPDSVFSMDSRAGAITEAVEAGANLDQIRRTATHSDLQTTMRYNRSGYADGAAEVLQLRTGSRKKTPGTEA